MDWSSVIAVVGTLGGTLLGGAVQLRAARVERRETRCEARRADALAAVTELVCALADHRRAMWRREERRLAGAEPAAVDAARHASHETRSAVTAPLTRLSLLVPSLRDVANQAAKAAYAMRLSPDLDKLETRRAAAVKASNELVLQASTGVTVIAVTPARRRGDAV